MKEIKKEFRWFFITEYEKEEICSPWILQRKI